jgi:hypothetical protein
MGASVRFHVQKGHRACLLDLWAVVGDDGQAYSCASMEPLAEIEADRLNAAAERGEPPPPPLRVR